MGNNGNAQKVPLTCGFRRNVTVTVWAKFKLHERVRVCFMSVYEIFLQRV